MRYQQDYILRQIEMLARFMARVAFGREPEPYRIADERALTDADRLWLRLIDCIAQGDYNGGENLLFERFVPEPAFLAVAMDYYQRLSELDDEELERGDFAREEILDGLESIARQFGIDPEI